MSKNDAPQHGSWRPKLRQEVRYVAPSGSTGGYLEDRLTRRRIRLGEVGALVCHKLVSEDLPLGELLEGVQLALSALRESVEEAFRSLLLLNLIEGAGAEIVEQLRQVQGGRLPSLQVLPETRFGCVGSGDCCKSYAYGPLTEQDLARLANLDIEGAFPHLQGQAFLEQQEVARGEDGQRRYGIFLRALENDRCIFLAQDNRCGLHVAFGPESKPALCTDYPLNFVTSGSAIRVYNVGECSCYAETSRRGPPLLAEPDRLRRVLPPSFDFQRSMQHPILQLSGHTLVDIGHFLRLVDALLLRFERTETGPVAWPGRLLLEAAWLLQRFAEAVQSFPLTPEEPERTLSLLIKEALAPCPSDHEPRRPQGDPNQGLCALAELSGELHREALFRIARLEGPRLAEAQLSGRNLAEFARVAQVVRLLTGERAGLMDWPLPTFHREVLACKAQAPENVAEVFRLSFRQYFFGARALIAMDPLAGLLRLGFVYLMTLTAARMKAVESGRSSFVLEDWNHGHMLSQRVLRQADLATILVHQQRRVFDMILGASSFFDPL